MEDFKLKKIKLYFKKNKKKIFNNKKMMIMIKLSYINKFLLIMLNK